LMIRMAGFEMYAHEHGYVGEFYTVTCPSKFHRFSKGELNENYECTPKDGQQYLVKIWSKIRAEFDRKDLKPFGFRVAEPHQDGCPHWHMLLFIRPEQRELIRGIMSHYALEMDGNEPGAQQHRFKYVEIDSQLGTATGYIAKYISKNLGFSIDDAEKDTNAESVLYGQRVKAWASVWGIRQFQQFGGAPVTVWRQLRKIREPLTDDLFEQARLAADQSRWSDYLQLMGGVDLDKDQLTIHLLKSQVINEDTGEFKRNKYGEVIELVFGLVYLLNTVITRSKTWVMTATNLTKSFESIQREAGDSPPRDAFLGVL
jgi:hypothetical protein